MSCTVELRDKETLELAKLLALRPIDPLAAAWLLFVECNTATYQCQLWQIKYEVLITPWLVFDIFRQRELTDSAHAGFNTRGNVLGLWEYEHIRCSGDPIIQLGWAIYGKFKRSNKFIERFASYAFLCMYVGMKTGRDIASIIARKVAKMYLDDYMWMANLSSRITLSRQFEKEIRERMMRWLSPIVELI